MEPGCTAVIHGRSMAVHAPTWRRRACGSASRRGGANMASASGQPHRADDHPRLSAKHLTMLREESGIAEAVIAERGYRTIEGPTAYTELKALGFSNVQAKLSP